MVSLPACERVSVLGVRGLGVTLPARCASWAGVWGKLGKRGGNEAYGGEPRIDGARGGDPAVDPLDLSPPHPKKADMSRWPTQIAAALGRVMPQACFQHDDARRAAPVVLRSSAVGCVISRTITNAAFNRRRVKSRTLHIAPHPPHSCHLPLLEQSATLTETGRARLCSHPRAVAHVRSDPASFS